MELFKGVVNRKRLRNTALNSFLISSEITKQFVIISFIEDNETNLPIEKHTLRVLYDNLKKMFAKFDSMLRL